MYLFFSFFFCQTLSPCSCTSSPSRRCSRAHPSRSSASPKGTRRPELNGFSTGSQFPKTNGKGENKNIGKYIRSIKIRSIPLKKTGVFLLALNRIPGGRANGCHADRRPTMLHMIKSNLPSFLSFFLSSFSFFRAP